jgi:hypothetical protein
MPGVFFSKSSRCSFVHLFGNTQMSAQELTDLFLSFLGGRSHSGRTRPASMIVQEGTPDKPPGILPRAHAAHAAHVAPPQRGRVIV